MQLLDLPNEILSRITSFLDTPSPFDAKILQKPTVEWGEGGNSARIPISETTLKSLSTTNQVLRTLTLPVLFKHVVLNPERLTEFLTFLVQNDLCNRVTSMVAVLAGHYNHIHPAWWARLLNDVPAIHLGIVAAPQVLTELAGVSSCSDLWTFDIPFQMLRFDRSSESTRCKIDYDNLPSILEVGPWTNLVVNEGSSVLAYTTSEYWLKRTPSLLSAFHLEHSSAGEAMLANLSSFEFVAIYPFYNHVDEVLKAIRKMVKLEKLYVKLCPDQDDKALNDEVSMAGLDLDMNDTWNESDTSWRLIAYNAAALGKTGRLRELRMADVQVEEVRPALESSLNRVLQDSWTYGGPGSGLWRRKPISAPVNNESSSVAQ